MTKNQRKKQLPSKKKNSIQRHQDLYESLQQLKSTESPRVWTEELVDRQSAVVVVAPHGGNIEFLTSNIARHIAGQEYSYYIFEGLIKTEQACFSRLHVTSTKFRDPLLTLLQNNAKVTVAIHGEKNKENKYTIVGGLNTTLRKYVLGHLLEAGFSARIASSGKYAGNDARNFVNSTEDYGVQLEISRAERTSLSRSKQRMSTFAEAIRAALVQHISDSVIDSITPESEPDSYLPSYSEPKKIAVRKAVLTHAVEALTSARDSSAVVTKEFFERNFDYAVNYVNKYGDSSDVLYSTEFSKIWHSVHESKIGNKKAKDLNVLILCGPTPLNDFLVLLDSGVSPFNVWAVENDNDYYNAAIESLRSSGFPFRIYRGGLQEFFSVVPQQFDIVYFDACGPLFGGNPRTISVIKELFLNQRLAPLSVLITNFAGVTMNASQLNLWVQRLATWYAPRYQLPLEFDEDHDIRCAEYMDDSDKQPFIEHVQAGLEEYYSHFITNFITEFAAQLLPWWRVIGLSGARKQLLAAESLQKQSLSLSKSIPEKVDWSNPKLEEFGHATLTPTSYPLYWAAYFSKTKLPANDQFQNFFYQDRHFGKCLGDVLPIVSLIRNYPESSQNRVACSDTFNDVLNGFYWFDAERELSREYRKDGMGYTRRFKPRLFCDVPTLHLLIDLILGQYGYPYIFNARKQLRLKYTAKQTPMFTDVFVFDQARYLYDFAPALELVETLPPQMQLLLRVCMDGIGQHFSDTDIDLFNFAHLAGWGERGYYKTDYSLPPRRDIDAELSIDEYD